MQHNVIVLKFGSSVLRTPADLPNAVHEIYRWYRQGMKVVAIVSATGDTTDRLLAESRQLSATPEPYALAELLATGERASAGALGVALDRSGIPARVLNPREIGLTVAGSPLDSELTELNLERVRELLTAYPVLVIPGFFGTDVAGRTHVLGRGGSDLSAVFVAQKLYARCRLIKDVDGVYESDPALSQTVSTRPRRLVALTYQDALKVAAPLIQPKAVDFLEQHASSAEVAACASGFESTVHAGGTELAAPAPPRPPRSCSWVSARSASASTRDLRPTLKPSRSWVPWYATAVGMSSSGSRAASCGPACSRSPSFAPTSWSVRCPPWKPRVSSPPSSCRGAPTWSRPTRH